MKYRLWLMLSPVAKLNVVITLIFIFLVSLNADAQNKDFGVWTGGPLKFKASKKIDLSLSPELRWDQNVSRLRNRILNFLASTMTFQMDLR